VVDEAERQPWPRADTRITIEVHTALSRFKPGRVLSASRRLGDIMTTDLQTFSRTLFAAADQLWR
jgi:hypothetical protein